MRVIAHRGNSRVAPQNTIAAFDAARRVGADVIELDIQVLADRGAAIIHDDTVDATTNGTGPVRSFTSEVITSLDAGSWFSPAFAGERVPLLTDLLDFLREGPAPDILLEAKGVWEEAALARALESIDAVGLAHKFTVQSFEAETVRRARDVAPHIPRHWLLEHWRADAIEVARSLGAAGINPAGTLLLEHPEFVAEAHAAGLSVYVWTLYEPQHWRAAAELGVDGIITDRPAMLAGWLAAHLPRP